MEIQQKILVGKIVAPQGIKGEFRVQAFTEKPEDLINLPIVSENINIKDIKFIRKLKHGSDIMIAKISGLDSRNEVECLRGTELFVYRSELPDLPDNQYYQIDLLSMPVFENGKMLGTVDNIQNYGANDILELDTGLLVSFDMVNVDMNKKQIIIK